MGVEATVRELLRRAIWRTPLYDPIRGWRQGRELRAWERDGRRAPPPPRFKQRLVRVYGKRLGLEVLIETGTFWGDMVAGCRDAFAEIHSIELDPWLHRRARRRFSKDSNVYLLHGDSADLLPKLARRIERPCLFWLDAHAMVGGVRGARLTPVAAELEAVLRRGTEGDAVLVDDVRLFTGRSEYPAIDAVRELVRERRPGWSVEVRDDVLRAHRGAFSR